MRLEPPILKEVKTVRVKAQSAAETRDSLKQRRNAQQKGHMGRKLQYYYSGPAACIHGGHPGGVFQWSPTQLYERERQRGLYAGAQPNLAQGG